MVSYFLNLPITCIYNIMIFITWNGSISIGEMKLPGMNTARFLRIAKVANVILTIPYSNAVADLP